MVKNFNNQSNYLSNQVQLGGNKRYNGNSAPTSKANKYFKREIKTFGAVLVLRYKRVYVNKYLDVFCGELMHCAIE